MEEKSLLEIAIELMQNQTKNKKYTLKEIAKKAFEKKGLKISENKELYAQFQMDFMLSGDFLSCGEDADGNKLWDLKYRFKHEDIEKDSVSRLVNPDDNDSEVSKNELNTSEGQFDLEEDQEKRDDSEDEEDELDEEDDEEDDIQKELKENVASVESEDVEEDNYDDE